MKRVAARLAEAVNNAAVLMKNIPDDDFARRPAPGKWSRKEILGHLLDSAFNNHRRFVAGQTENIPQIIYHQNEWVDLQNYQAIPKNILIQLWWMMNIHIAHVLEMMPEENYFKEVNTGKDKAELHNLHWLAEDYLSHMKHHLGQILI